MAVALTFLEMNGGELNAPKDAFYELVLGVAEGKVSRSVVAVFLQTHAR